MTEIIQLTGNKANFSNYLSETLLLPEDAQICLNKASFSIPIISLNYITVPFVNPLNYGDTMCDVQINSVTVAITFQNFYDAYIVVSTLEAPTIAEFYNEATPYKLLINNKINFYNAAGTIYKQPSFTEILSQASETGFTFYSFDTMDEFTPEQNIIDYSNEQLSVNGIDLTVAQDSNLKINIFGLVGKYNPYKVYTITPVSTAWVVANVIGFTPNADGIVSTAGPSMAVFPDEFDPNGGYIGAVAQVGAGTLCMGLVLTGEGHDDNVNLTAVYEPETLDVGIEWELLGTGERVLQIIDGKQKFVYYDSTANAEVITTKPHYQPTGKFLTWDHNQDHFWFQVQRGRSMNGTTEFVIRIIQGENIQDIAGASSKTIYIAKRTLNTSDIRIKTLAFSNGLGNGLDNCQYVPYQAQSGYQDEEGNIQNAQTFSIIPTLNNTFIGNFERFWDEVGLVQSFSEDNNILTTAGNGYTKILKWKPKPQSTNYFVGKNKISDIFENDTANTYLKLKSGSNTIPRQIEVSIMDLPINPLAGSFIGATNQYDSGTYNNVISYVNTDKEDLYLDTNANLDYVYESYNLIYRRLKNQQKMPITQLNIKLGYKDFETNKDNIIDNIAGIVKLEVIINKE
tara:strand:- start:1442 stop:3319 length:1878 start_codon:yes stop_codon:yes gene_type:complete